VAAEVRAPSAAAINEIMDIYRRKIEGGLLPPDPARIVERILRIPVEIEHAVPVPPILEYAHTKVVKPFVESLPRLPYTSDFHEAAFLAWIKEEGLRF